VGRGAAAGYSGQAEDPGRVAVVHQAQDLQRQLEAGQRRPTGPPRLGNVVWVGDRALAAPAALPERALAPVPADVMLRDEVVPGHQGGAEEGGGGEAKDERGGGAGAGGDRGDLPLRRAGVQYEVRVILEQLLEVVGVLRVPPHVGGDERDVRELLQQPQQAWVLVRL